MPSISLNMYESFCDQLSSRFAELKLSEEIVWLIISFASLIFWIVSFVMVFLSFRFRFSYYTGFNIRLLYNVYFLLNSFGCLLPR